MQVYLKIKHYIILPRGFLNPINFHIHKLKYFVNEDPNKVNLKNYFLKNVNCMPVLIEGENNIPIVGYIIKFKKKKSENAYRRISFSGKMLSASSEKLSNA